MEQKELNEILESHERWLQSEGGECADLHGADLCEANLRWANLHKADFHGADLCGADLRWADFHGADLYDADLRWADFHGANLCGASFHGANLRWANLRKADLCGADLSGADLYDADLRWADFHGANLCGASFHGANLRWADLRKADLCGADLRWADFANVTGLSVLSVQVNTSCQNRKITYIPSLDIVTAGYFQGTFEEFEERAEEEHKNNLFVLSRYRRVIAFLKQEAEEDRKREKEMTTANEGRR